MLVSPKETPKFMSLQILLLVLYLYVSTITYLIISNTLQSKFIIMSIIYSLICRLDLTAGVVPLCQYDSATGNYPQIIIEMAKQLKQESIKKTYKYNSEFNFHIVKEKSYAFIVMADVIYDQKIAFNFLEDLKLKFNQRYTKEQINHAKSFQLGSFNSIFTSLVAEYNQKKMDKRIELSQKLSSIKDLLTENIQKLLQKEDKVAVLVNRTNNTDEFANNIRNNAGRKTVSNKKWLKMGAAAVILVIILYLLFGGKESRESVSN